MKKLSGFLAIAVAFVFVGCNPTVKGKNGVEYHSAVEYNDYIVKKQTEVYGYFFKLSDAFNASDFKKAGQLLAEAKPIVNNTITDVEGMPEWKENHALRDAAVDLFKFYKRSFEGDYQLIVDIGGGSREATPQETEHLTNMEKTLGDEEAKYDNAMQAEQAAFAKANNIKIEASKLQDKVDKLNQ